jgi:hypothetical protein
MKPEDRDFDIGRMHNRKAVCKRCKYAVNDCEPGCRFGEFYHPSVDLKNNRINCPNAGKTFHVNSLEIEPFVRKRVRRLEKRLKRLVRKPK